MARVLLFGRLSDLAGWREREIESPFLSTLRAALADEDAALGEALGGPGVQVALDQVIVRGDAPLSAKTEVAFLPPMSGGAPRPWVQDTALSLDALLAEISDASVGGIATFTGVVRNHARGQAIDHLEYEAYVPMAEKEMRAIAEQVRQRWPGARIAMAHRVGRLEIGEAAVMIAVGTPHRAAAFDACRFAIDELKRSVPIWKKEFAESGTYWVEENP